MMEALFIVNPISGKAGSRKKAADALRRRGCRVVFTEYAGHAAELARGAAEEVVVAVGGDGTVNEVARAIAGTGKTLGIVPCGSGDGLALCLGLSRDPDKAVDTVLAGRTRMMDYGLMDGKPFFSVCGAGFDALVSHRFAHAGSRGLRTYVREIVRAWFSYVPEVYELDIDGIKTCCEAVLVTAANSDQWGNGARIAPHADPCDGMIDIAVVKPFRLWSAPRFALQLMCGSLGRNSHVSYFRGRDIVLKRAGAGPLHYDGDCAEGGKEVRINIAEDRLKVIVP